VVICKCIVLELSCCFGVRVYGIRFGTVHFEMCLPENFKGLLSEGMYVVCLGWHLTAHLRRASFY